MEKQMLIICQNKSFAKIFKDILKNNQKEIDGDFIFLIPEKEEEKEVWRDTIIAPIKANLYDVMYSICDDDETERIDETIEEFLSSYKGCMICLSKLCIDLTSEDSILKSFEKIM